MNYKDNLKKLRKNVNLTGANVTPIEELRLITRSFSEPNDGMDIAIFPNRALNYTTLISIQVINSEHYSLYINGGTSQAILVRMPRYQELLDFINQKILTPLFKKTWRIERVPGRDFLRIIVNGTEALYLRNARRFYNFNSASPGGAPQANFPRRLKIRTTSQIPEFSLTHDLAGREVESEERTVEGHFDPDHGISESEVNA